MRKIALVAVMLMLAAPALARVDITCTNDGNEVTISYSVVGEPNKIRAFALDISVSDGNIVGIKDFKTGVSVVGDKGYGIYPYSFDQVITLDGNGVPTNWGDAGYTPLAQDDYKGALGGLDTNGITIEMGSLYDPANPTDAPDNSGDLCTIIVSDECTVSISENQTRGGVVSERVVDVPSYVVDVNAPGCEVLFECLVVGQTVGCQVITQTMYDTWANLNSIQPTAPDKPVSWCWPCHARGDGDNSCTIVPADVLILMAAWPPFGGVYDPAADYDNSGGIAPADVLAMMAAWPPFGGPGCAGCPGCP
jgi:hypothetical protein